jgi:nucleoside-diphosphate-sugar epimerase
MINLNTVDRCIRYGIKNVFLASSACAYGEDLQKDALNPNCAEDTIWKSRPDSKYGIEKLFAEELYDAYSKNKSLKVAIGRYHNIFGPESVYAGGKEKAPAALCRKVAEAKDGTHIEIFGNGTQTRSFLYIDECLDGTLRLMESDFQKPINIGSEVMISINDLAKMVIEISGKKLDVHHIPGPIGVMGRNSDNNLIRKTLNSLKTLDNHPVKRNLLRLYMDDVKSRVLNKNLPEKIRSHFRTLIITLNRQTLES